MFKSLKIVLVAATLLLASQAGAATTVFSDRSSFLAAGDGVTNHVTPSFGSRTAPISFDGLTIGPVTSNFASNFSTASGIPNALIFSDPSGENFDVAIDESVFGFGFDVFEPTSSASSFCNVNPCAASTFEVTLLDGTTEVGSESFTPTPSNTETTFFGITSTVLFDGVEIRETVGSNDNEHFGNFTTLSVAQVPAPAPFALLLAGLAGLALYKRRSAARA